MDFEVRFVMKNIPADVVMTSELPEKVRFTLKDKGSQLLSYYYSGTLPVISIDFLNYDQRSGHVVLKNSDINKMLLSRLQASTRIVAMKPDVIEYYYNYGLHARVPVKLHSDIVPMRSYAVSSVRVKPDSVNVYAPKNILDTITCVTTEFLQMHELTSRSVRRARLLHGKGMKIDPQSVIVRVDVDQMTEKSCQVPVCFVNFPADKVFRSFPPKVTVTFQVPTRMYRQIDANDFAIAVNYDDVLKSDSGKMQLILNTIPAGVSHVRMEPDEVDFLVEESVSDEH